MTTYIANQVRAAYARALVETRTIAGGGVGCTVALTVLHQRGCPAGPGPFTENTVSAHWNKLANDAKEDYNPEHDEDEDTIQADSCGDLVVNLALGFLRDPFAKTDAVIAESWHDLELTEGPDEPGGERDLAINAEVRSWVA